MMKKSGKLLGVVLLVLGACGISLNAFAQAVPAPPAQAASGNAEPRGDGVSFVQVKCVTVKDLDLFERFRGWISGDSRDGLKTGGARADCAGAGGDSGMLVGSGDLEVVVDRSSFQSLLEQRKSQAGEILLYLNGVALIKDATYLGGDHDGLNTLLHFRITQGQDTQKLWSMLYTDKGLFDPHPLHVSLGWRSASGANVTLPERPKLQRQPYVAITTGWHLTAALILIALTAWVVFFMARNSDALRDEGLPAWWVYAMKLRERVTGLSPAERDAELAREFGATYAAANRQIYKNLANAALRRIAVDAAQQDETTIGLVLYDKPWKPVRASFSLTKTQLALWFTFAVATGIFLWVLYGDLRRIDGSLLALLGISVTSASVSWAADRNAGGRPYLPSQGFWADLVTGFDEQQQIHRYQAVVVNVLLLFVGIVHVLQQLTYPVFEPTWLLFLGVSGAAFGIGKQMLEKPAK